MSASKKTERDHVEIARAKLLVAALPHVDFDGWSDETFQLAIADAGVDQGLASQACPRGGLDLAVAFHRAGDAEMVLGFNSANVSDLKYSEKVALLVRFRLEASAQNKEAVRKGASLFALPQNISEGTALVWGTVDTIWNTLGDTSTDANWYTKRATLSAVYSSTLLFWLGDTSDNHEDTWAFLDRRIENVMKFESVKAKIIDGPIGRSITELMERFSKPNNDHKSDFPGYKT